LRPGAQVLQRQDLVTRVRALVAGGEMDETGPELLGSVSFSR
jgi:hypothetical protein